MRSDLPDLRKTMEELRRRDHPNIPAELVSRIIDAEASNPEDEAAAMRDVRLAIEDNIDQVEGE